MLQIENHPGDGLRIAGDGHLDDIVMTVAERIGGRPVKSFVLLIGEVFGPADMRGGELHLF